VSLKAEFFSSNLMRRRIFTGDVVEGAVWLVTGESQRALPRE
jgi:hypothetical protein